jgi:hypothetical protein
MKTSIIPSSTLSGLGGGGSKGVGTLGTGNNAAPGPAAGADGDVKEAVQSGPLSSNPANLAPKSGDGSLESEYGNFSKVINGISLAANTSVAAKGGDL